MTDRDAAFREALDALIRASGDVGGMTFSEGSNVHHPAAQRLLAAEARVLALYAEREGEVYEVQMVAEEAFNVWEDGTREYYPDIVLRGPHPLKVNEGDRVTVRRCGEGV